MPRNRLKPTSISLNPPVEMDPQQELEQVQRALAVLAGKDPERDALVRQQIAGEEARLSQIREKIMARRRERGAKTRRKLVRGLVAVVATAAACVGGYRIMHPRLQRRDREQRLLSDIERDGGAYTSLGFRAVARPWYRAASSVDLTADASTCWLALGRADQGTVRLRIERGADATETGSAAAWCTCTAEPLRITTQGAEGALTAVALYRASGAAVGGPYGLSITLPGLPAGNPDTLECATDQLDAWIAAARYPSSSVHASEGDATPPSLEHAGFGFFARLDAAVPFVVVAGAPRSCFLAVDAQTSDSLSLQVRGGIRALQDKKSSMAWCDSERRPALLWRRGTGAPKVYSVSSARVGGLLGVREAALRAGLPEPATFARHEDLAEDAADALRVLGIPRPTVMVFTGDAASGTVADARVVALSVADQASASPDHKHAATCVCSPALSERSSQALCVQSWPQTWLASGGTAQVGAAAFSLPFWMLTFSSVDDPRGVAQELSLLKLARRLAAEQFHPTILEGVTERDDGLDVLGQAGEDAIVAVTLVAQPPFIYPYSNGLPWAIDGEPRVVPLQPGSHVVLKGGPPKSIPKSDRRPVVFRHLHAPS